MNTELTSILSGQGVSLVTPFNALGEVDYPSLENLVSRCISGDADYLLVLGPSSECSLLSIEEQDRILDFVIEINANALPLVAGIASLDTRAAVQRVSSIGQNGIVAIYCAASNPMASSQSGHLGHFRSIAEAANKPILIQSPSSTSGNCMKAETILTLAEEPNITAVVECSGDVALNGMLLRKRPVGFSILSGRDVMTLPLLALGVDGAVTSLGNAFCKSWGAMTHRMLFGSVNDARVTHHIFAPLMRILEMEGEPTGIKTILAHLNLCESRVRLPNTPVSEDIKIALYRAIAELPHQALSKQEIQA